MVDGFSKRKGYTINVHQAVIKVPKLQKMELKVSQSRKQSHFLFLSVGRSSCKPIPNFRRNKTTEIRIVEDLRDPPYKIILNFCNKKVIRLLQIKNKITRRQIQREEDIP